MRLSHLQSSSSLTHHLCLRCCTFLVWQLSRSASTAAPHAATVSRLEGHQALKFHQDAIFTSVVCRAAHDRSVFLLYFLESGCMTALMICGKWLITEWQDLTLLTHNQSCNFTFLCVNISHSAWLAPFDWLLVTSVA